MPSRFTATSREGNYKSDSHKIGDLLSGRYGLCGFKSNFSKKTHITSVYNCIGGCRINLSPDIYGSKVRFCLFWPWPSPDPVNRANSSAHLINQILLSELVTLLNPERVTRYRFSKGKKFPLTETDGWKRRMQCAGRSFDAVRVGEVDGIVCSAVCS